MNEQSQIYNPRMMKPSSFASTRSSGMAPVMLPPDGKVNGYAAAPMPAYSDGASSVRVSNPGMNANIRSSHSSGTNSVNAMYSQNSIDNVPPHGPQNVFQPSQNSQYTSARPLIEVANRSQSFQGVKPTSALPSGSNFQPVSVIPPASQANAPSSFSNVASRPSNILQNQIVQPSDPKGQPIQQHSNFMRPPNAINSEFSAQPSSNVGQYIHSNTSVNRFPGSTRPQGSMPSHPPPSGQNNSNLIGTQLVGNELNPSRPSNNILPSMISPNVPPHIQNSSISGPNSGTQHSEMPKYSQPTYSSPNFGNMPGVPPSCSMAPSQPSNFSSVSNSIGGQYQPPGMTASVPNAYNQNQFRTNQSVSAQSSARPPQYGRNFGPVGGGMQPDQLASRVGSMNIYGGSEGINILQNKNVLPETALPVPRPPISDQQSNCSPDIIRCTLNCLPESQNLLQKVRLPLGILIHPFKDISNLPVIQCTTIVRCRSCRTYINPFVFFVDAKRWKCNLCYRVNELPEEFLFDPVSKQYGDPSRRPEVKVSTIEFIAPSEYMLRPPQPAVYLYLIDVSRNAIATGYLDVFCKTLLAEIDNIPGDARTQIGFITFDSCVHFYNLSEGLAQPQMMIVSDIDDIFIPCPDSLLVNIHECKDLVKDLLTKLPSMFEGNLETKNALGAALQAAYKLMAPTGGRISIMQTSLPSVGPGMLKSREDPNQRAAKDIQNLGPANDFYKKLALDCSGQQIAVDLFILSSQYTDIATLSCISKFSGGCIHQYPGFQASANPSLTDSFKNDLRRYVTRKIGFEAVMRIRCSRGISIHTFHGNFFVRSTDLLSLPNINPDAAFGMHMSIEDSLSDCKSVCFQAALLYTSTAGERRIRVHTLCLPVTNSISDVISNADQQAIAVLVAKMAVDRSLTSSLSDAREALVSVPVDAFGAFQQILSSQPSGALMVPVSLRLLPLYILAILKNISFRVGTSTKLDQRVFAMNQLKTLPLSQLILSVYPEMYPVHALGNYSKVEFEGSEVAQPPIFHLSSERTDRNGAYLMDAGRTMYLYVCSAISDSFCQNVLGVPCFSAISEEMLRLPELDNLESKMIRTFIKFLNSRRRVYSSFRVIRDDSKLKSLFLQHIIEDRSESTYSYYEFLQHIQQQICK